MAHGFPQKPSRNRFGNLQPHSGSPYTHLFCASDNFGHKAWLRSSQDSREQFKTIGKTKPSNLVSFEFSTRREMEHLQGRAAGRRGPTTALLCQGACSLLAGGDGSSPAPQHQWVRIHSRTRNIVFGSWDMRGCDVADGHLLTPSGPAGLIFPRPSTEKLLCACCQPCKKSLILHKKDLGFFTENRWALCHEATASLLSPPNPLGSLPSLQPQVDDLLSAGESKGRSRKTDPDFVQTRGARVKERGLNMSEQSGTLPPWCIFARSSPFSAKCTF